MKIQAKRFKISLLQSESSLGNLWDSLNKYYIFELVYQYFTILIYYLIKNILLKCRSVTQHRSQKQSINAHHLAVGHRTSRSSWIFGCYSGLRFVSFVQRYFMQDFGHTHTHTHISGHIFYFLLRALFRDFKNITKVGHPSQERGRFGSLYENELASSHTGHAFVNQLVLINLVLGIEPRASGMPISHSVAELCQAVHVNLCYDCPLVLL